MQKNTIYQGRFKGLDEGVIYTVRIEFEKDNTVSGQNIISIGDTGDSIMFNGSDTVEINSEVNDTFDHIMQTSATIRLLVKDDHPEFYTSDYRKVMVTIYGKPYVEGASYNNPNRTESGAIALEDFGIVLFTGYVVPLSYQQGYDQEWDELELSCMDVLSSLRYRKFNGVNSEKQYKGAKARSDLSTFKDVILDALWGSRDGKVINQLPEGCIGTVRNGRGEVFHDVSVKATEDSTLSIFVELSVRDDLFLGDEYDDVVNYEDVLNKMLTFLNMRIVMDNGRFLIYSYETVKNVSEESTAITFAHITSNMGGLSYSATQRPTTLSIANNISREEVFNRINVKANVEAMEEDLVEDPLDDENTNSDYDTELYVKEYVADAKDGPITEFRRMIKTGEEQDPCNIYNQYFRILKNNNWSGVNVTKGSSTSQFTDLLNHFENGGTAALVAFGDTINFKNMSRYFVLKPNSTTLAVSAQCSGRNITVPSASDATKYCLVISGNIIFTPRPDRQISLWKRAIITLGRYNRQELVSGASPLIDIDDVWPEKQRYKNSEEKYYTPDFISNGVGTTTNGLIPPVTDRLMNLCKFREIPRLEVLKCRLWFSYTENGTTKYKYLRRHDDDTSYNWVNYSDYFYICISVKEDDYLVGSDFEILNENIYETEQDTRYEFDDKGMIIPLPEEGVKGTIHFSIEEGANVIVTDEETQEQSGLWSKVEALMMKDFNVKIKASVKAADDFTDKSDIVYYSDTDETFLNDKEIGFDLHSGITDADIERMGLEASDKVMLSVPVKEVTVGGVKSIEEIYTIYDTMNEQTLKAEDRYVDACYREHGKPLVEMQMTVREGINADGLSSGNYVFYHYWSKWQFPASNSVMSQKLFWPFAISHNLKECTAEIKMKEVNARKLSRQTTIGYYPTSKK